MCSFLLCGQVIQLHIILSNTYHRSYVGHYSYPHFTDGEIEAQRSWVTCPKSPCSSRIHSYTSLTPKTTCSASTSCFLSHHTPPSLSLCSHFSWMDGATASHIMKSPPACHFITQGLNHSPELHLTPLPQPTQSLITHRAPELSPSALRE